MYNLYSILLAVYAISIKNPTGKHLHSFFNLCSDGISSDSTHIRNIVTHFVKIAIEAPISLYTNMAAVFRFPS